MVQKITKIYCDRCGKEIDTSDYKKIPPNCLER